MAYIDQEMKRTIAAKMKEVCAASNTKFTLSISNYSQLNVTIKSSDLPLLKNHIAKSRYEASLQGGSWRGAGLEEDATFSEQVNHHWLQYQFTGKCLTFMKQLLGAVNCLNHNNSDPQRDHFDVGYYLNFNIGTYKVPFVQTGV